VGRFKPPRIKRSVDCALRHYHRCWFATDLTRFFYVRVQCQLPHPLAALDALDNAVFYASVFHSVRYPAPLGLSVEIAPAIWGNIMRLRCDSDGARQAFANCIFKELVRNCCAIIHHFSNIRHLPDTGFSQSKPSWLTRWGCAVFVDLIKNPRCSKCVEMMALRISEPERPGFDSRTSNARNALAPKLWWCRFPAK
jgi:hypothetical protein